VIAEDAKAEASSWSSNDHVPGLFSTPPAKEPTSSKTALNEIRAHVKWYAKFFGMTAEDVLGGCPSLYCMGMSGVLKRIVLGIKY